MADAAVARRAVFLSNQTAGPQTRRVAGLVAIVSTLAFLLLAPYARMPLLPLPAFIAIYQSAQLITDVITAVFLFGQRQYSRSSALGRLAAGYLFAALMSSVHALTFPGLFTPTGLLGAGPQTTAWLYMFWHGGFPLFVLAYAASSADSRPSRRDAGAVACGIVLVVVAAGALTLLATRGDAWLPVLLDGHGYTPALLAAVWGVWLLTLFAGLAVARRRPYSVLDLWLMVAMGASLFDIALSAGLNAARFDLGFYAGRIYGFLAASFVLAVLLLQNSELYLQLVDLRESERAKTDELVRLNALDALTGIANRRAFEHALGEEWRRMLRHQTGLSLLMIDVDCFKRFNDTYGHVAGDKCLRAVAQVLAGRSRRAGEMAARYGGEEFAVLLPHAGLDAAEKLGAALCEAVRALQIPHQDSTAAGVVTISIGAACIAGIPKSAAAFSREGGAGAVPAGATALIEAADGALYAAKHGGRNRVAVAGACDGPPMGQRPEKNPARDEERYARLSARPPVAL